MRITPHFHVLNHTFSIPLPSGPILRSVNIVVIVTDRITVIDSGTAGADRLLFSYLESIGRNAKDVEILCFTHSHPDHIGSARSIRALTGCETVAHVAESAWIEDVELQARQRPVPGFAELVEGPVPVNLLLSGGETVPVGGGLHLEVLHTPGHSPGSISLWCPEERVLVSGDAVPVPGEMPIFDHWPDSHSSLQMLNSKPAEWLVSSWEPPASGKRIEACLSSGVAWLERTRAAASGRKEHAGDVMAFCRMVAADLGLPPAAVNPLVAKSFLACLEGER